MNENSLLNPEALKAVRKKANRKQGYTQETLAEKIGCSKDTISRWERGKALRVRSHLRERLCEVLGVEWDVLTMSPDPSENQQPGLTRLQQWVSPHAVTALTLVANRYGIRQRDVLEVAPLLFLIVAEQSLLERRQKLDEIYAIQDEADERVLKISTHLDRTIVARSISAEEILGQEEDSLRARDIFGRLFDAEYRKEDDEYWGDHGGPFVDFVRRLTNGLPQDAVTSIESDGSDMIERYRLADDTLRQLTDLDGNEDEEKQVILDYIQSGCIDLGKCIKERRQRNNAGYHQWLRDELTEVRAENERWLKNLLIELEATPDASQQGED